MTYGYLPVERFDVEKVSFCVIGSAQPFQSTLAPFHQLWALLVGKQPLHLSLMALTDQETAGNLTEMRQMETYGKKYLLQATKLALKQGFFVVSMSWDGIIHPDNLLTLKNSAGWKVWEFAGKTS